MTVLVLNVGIHLMSLIMLDSEQDIFCVPGFSLSTMDKCHFSDTQRFSTDGKEHNQENTIFCFL